MSILYVINLTYIKPMNEVDHFIFEHVEWLKQGYAEGIFLASGRKVPRTGGIILARATDLASLQDRLRLDPFQREEIAKVDITPFEVSMKADFLSEIF